MPLTIAYISLGRDRNIVIGRVKNDEYKQVRFLGTHAVESRGFDILVRNKKSQAVHLTITDQIPVPVISTISVKELMLSGGALDKESGLVTWKLDLQPGTQKELVLQYEVRYPRGQRVVLE